MACPSCCNKSTNSTSPCHSHPTARQKLDAVSPFHLSLLTFHPSHPFRGPHSLGKASVKIRSRGRLRTCRSRTNKCTLKEILCHLRSLLSSVSSRESNCD